MYLISTNLEEVSREFEFVDSWIETVCRDILFKNKEECKVSIFYNYGYFVPKSKGSDTSQYEMLFDDRLLYELSKVRVSVTIKIDDFMMSNRLKRGMIPEVIKSLVTEITKYKMKLEFEFHGNEDIKNSIPPYDESIVTIETIRQEIGSNDIEEEYFNLDDILDKISKNGIESLTEKERNFLDRKSKEI